MPVVDILRHLLCHDDFVGLQQIGVAISGFGRDLERDMQELTHVGVEFRMTGNDARSATFENPAHDHPRWIRYSVTSDGALRAEHDGAEGKQSFTFKRVTR